MDVTIFLLMRTQMVVTPRSPMHDLPDSVLIRRFLDGEESAFRALYQRHTPRLRMIVWRLLGARHEETDDVIQETWMAGCRGMHRYNGEAKFASWLTTIGIRRAQSRWSQRNEQASEPFEIADSSPPDGPATAIDLERAIARLPDHQRAVVVLHDIEGFTPRRDREPAWYRVRYFQSHALSGARRIAPDVERRSLQCQMILKSTN